MTEKTPMQQLQELVLANAVQVERKADAAVDVVFFGVKQNEHSSLTDVQLAAAIKAAEHGSFADEPIERLQQGPSYIELGGWIGDQGMALMLMGLGEILKLWKVITPALLHMEERETELAGAGYVMIAPEKGALFE